MTAAVEGGEWSAARPGRILPPEKTRYTFYRRLSGSQGRSGWAEKSRPYRDSIPNRPARSSVAIPTELPGPQGKVYILVITPTICTDFSNLFFGIKLYMFRSVPLSIISSFSLYTQQWYVSYRLCWQPASRIRTDQTCTTYTIAVCTVKNCWWWTEELSETCRVLFQK